MTDNLEKKLLEKDCFECRVSGTAASAALGAYVFYYSYPGRFKGGKGHQLFMRAFATGKLLLFE